MVEEPDEERLKEWVEEKLDEGVDRERLKESLQETGHDPSIVDESNHPFSEESEIESDPFEETSTETNEENEETDEIEELEQEKDEVQEVEEQDFEPEPKTEDASEESSFAESDDESSSRFPGIPSFDIPRKYPLKKVGLVVLILALSAAVFTVLGQKGVIDSNTGEVVSSNDCPDVGVKIASISSSAGSTTATVRVDRGEAEVVLEIFDDGGKVGETTATVQGEEKLTVSGVGSRVRLHPEGCLKILHETTY